jgi:putative nucleotidyltransferase with HDIG domain
LIFKNKMMNNIFYEELIKKVKPALGDKGSHDFNHVERVYNYAILISKGLDVDMDIVKTSALLHDISKRKEESGKIQDHAAHGAIEARKILEKTTFPKEKIEAVCKCIVMHNKKGTPMDTKEERVLKEADAMEIIGAVGIARIFSYNGEKNPWDDFSPESPLRYLIEVSSSNYFQLPIAKEMARDRIKIIKDFCSSFIKETEIKN